MRTTHPLQRISDCQCQSQPHFAIASRSRSTSPPHPRAQSRSICPQPAGRTLSTSDHRMSDAEKLTEPSHAAGPRNQCRTTSPPVLPPALGASVNNKETFPVPLPPMSVAFDKLQRLRSDLVTISSDVQFTFKESIEPTYRDYVSVITDGSTAANKTFKKARQVMEALQLAELDNYLPRCLLRFPSHSLWINIDPQAAVIYPIILRDRLEVILVFTATNPCATIQPPYPKPKSKPSSGTIVLIPESWISTRQRPGNFPRLL